MAIELLKTPQGSGLNAGPDAGLFSLPPEFDTKKFAAEWVESGQVQMKQQRQTIQQAGVTADGWEIWRKNKDDKATEVHTSGSKKFILMCRSRIVQDQVNAIYGNVSKQVLAREIKGETVTGVGGQVQDPGILTEDRLKNVLGGEFSGGGDIAPNTVEVKEKAFAEVSAAEKT
jgi:hypothetical protein